MNKYSIKSINNKLFKGDLAMSDKNIEKDELELNKPDFSLDIEDDELDLNIDDDVFSNGEEVSGSEKNDIEEDDILTEDELESLIIGIDEENDILDIPDEEEVLEELKFLDENFSVDDTEEEEEKPKEKSENKIKKMMEKPIFKKIKNIAGEKTKKEIIKKDTGKKSDDIKYFMMKNRFKLVGGLASFLLLVFIFTLVFTRDKEPLVEEVGKVEQAVNMSEIRPTIKELGSILDSLTPMEQLAYYRDRLIKEEENTKEIIELNNRIKALEAKLDEEAREKREAYIENLRKSFSGEMSSVKPATFKSSDERLQIAFLVIREDFYDDLYKVIEEAFIKNINIKDVNIILFTAGEQLNKAYEINVARHQFDSIRNISDSSKNKIEKLNLIAR